ncbi:hypothetical protein [Thermovibrio ammonificans]|jgi:hypothetical protein|uniref:Uncharacterized protein n=1 Tax=Thermovibrio ammonificans (strain DSM 15698 / JCM 12110 / HB-1) TaxID=648996 RepID=E8T300_THEA1|nr:hypothetical protein [Thermovibrio ammonificans]ADU97209.1 hypothetical protein Theam_1245 [Thermovibrio ammonificans HB-1]
MEKTAKETVKLLEALLSDSLLKGGLALFLIVVADGFWSLVFRLLGGNGESFLFTSETLSKLKELLSYTWGSEPASGVVSLITFFLLYLTLWSVGTVIQVLRQPLVYEKLKTSYKPWLLIETSVVRRYYELVERVVPTLGTAGECQQPGKLLTTCYGYSDYLLYQLLAVKGFKPKERAAEEFDSLSFLWSGSALVVPITLIPYIRGCPGLTVTFSLVFALLVMVALLPAEAPPMEPVTFTAVTFLAAAVFILLAKLNGSPLPLTVSAACLFLTLWQLGVSLTAHRLLSRNLRQLIAYCYNSSNQKQEG